MAEQVVFEEPSPADHFTFGIWAVGNIGRDPFGGPTRPQLEPAKVVELVGKAGGAYGVNFHDEDLVPIDATPAEAERLKKDFKKELERWGLKVPMATTNLFGDPAFKDGAFTSNDAEVRAYAIQKVMKAMELGAEFGAQTYVMWGGREGTEVDATKDPVTAVQRYREAVNFLCRYNEERGLGYRIALEAKPNEPRGHLFMATTGNYLGFIETLDRPEMVGVNPEFAHEAMAGLNFPHHVAQAIERGKLFHIDLNDQEFGRFDQDFRFGSINYKTAFYLVKLLYDYNYQGMKHFDAKGYRSSDWDDVIEFARGCMRTYKILEAKAKQFHEDPQIQKLIQKLHNDDQRLTELTGRYSSENAKALAEMGFDRQQMAERRRPHEELDQLVADLLLGMR
jgi:xylose isomerase